MWSGRIMLVLSTCWQIPQLAPCAILRSCSMSSGSRVNGLLRFAIISRGGGGISFCLLMQYAILIEKNITWTSIRGMLSAVWYPRVRDEGWRRFRLPEKTYDTPARLEGDAEAVAPLGPSQTTVRNPTWALVLSTQGRVRTLLLPGWAIPEKGAARNVENIRGEKI